MLDWRQESGHVSHKNHLFFPIVIESLYSSLQPFCDTLDFSFLDSIHILFLLYLLLWSRFSTAKLAGFH